MRATKTPPTDAGLFFALVLCPLLLLPAAGTAFAGEAPALSDKNPVRAELISDVAQAGLGEEYRVGVRFEMAPGWHIYWIYPGNTGKPTQVRFSSDETHTKVLEPRFPAPQVFDAKHIDDLSFGYAGSTLIWATAMTFDSAPEGKTRIAAELHWLACKQACVTGKAAPTMELPVAEAARPSPHKALFDQTQGLSPEMAGADQAWLAEARYVGGNWELRFGLGQDLKATDFVPRWLTGGSCKVIDYGLDFDPQGRRQARIRLSGDNCLPGVGGVLSAKGQAPRAISALSPGDRSTSSAPFAAPPDTRADENATTATTLPSLGGLEQESIWLMLLFAFLGGLLLNVMPCVIPVVIPKMMHVVRTAQKAENPAERRRLLWSNSLAYSAGVILTLLSLGLVVIALKQVGREVGWGFQFQNPWFLVFMVALMLVLGLGMLRVFSLQSAGHTDDLKSLRKVRRRSPLLESFLTGLLVTFLGTPCTAPLLGPALGYAFTASSGAILLFLATVGLGLATPFLLLGAWTGWARFLPSRVSEGYDRIMRGMAFLLFGTAVWLLGVLADGYGVDAAMNLIWFLLILGLGAWIFGLWTDAAEPWSKRSLKLAPIAFAAALFGAWVLEFPEGGRAQALGMHSQVGIDWRPFSDENLEQQRAAGKTIFIDFTAEWCMNCKANERLVIEKKETQAILQKLDIFSMKADATRFDPVIQKWLKRFGRAGVPMYLIFPACASDEQAILLPEILTSNTLHEALKKAGPSRGACSISATQ